MIDMDRLRLWWHASPYGLVGPYSTEERDKMFNDMRDCGFGFMKNGKRIDPRDVFIEGDGETLRIKEREDG